MALSVFETKAKMPAEDDLRKALETLYPAWKELKSFVLQHDADVTEEWNYSGKSFGWSLRLKNPKKVIVYLTPCSGSFLASFVLGPAATEEAMRSNISDKLKEIIDSAKVYAEGRGVRFEVKDPAIVGDLEKIVLIKLGIRPGHK
jgi:hypothetical protein